MEYGIATLESEFLANIVLPDGGTVGQWPAPQVDEAYATGKDAVDAVRGNCVSPSSRNLADVAQGVGRQHQVGVQRHGWAAVAQPCGNGVDVQPGLQPVSGAAVAQTMRGWTFGAGPRGSGLETRICDPVTDPSCRGPG